MITIAVKDASGRMLGAVSRAEEAALCIDRVYLPGDVVEIDGARHLFAQMDQALSPGEIYLPQGKMTWPVPWGEHRLAYPPGAFEAGRHVIRVREMTARELASIRNIALNPADLRGNTDFYPHCTANVETRNEACFCARNVIDGMRLNTFHGEWPFQSWGIGAREDAWCRIDFGREIYAESMALTLRADFPHDAYWTHGFAVLSDGAEVSFSLSRTGDRQTVSLEGHRISWIRLERLQKSDDPSAFPALSEWEVFGREAAETE